MVKHSEPPPSRIPAVRIEAANAAPFDREGRFVLYWMAAFRRAAWNYSLDRAVEWAAALKRPLAVVETLPCGRRWDCDRRHRFLLEGMADNARQFDHPGVLYYPLVERSPGEAVEAVAWLADQAAAVVTDDFPLRECETDLRAVAARVHRRMERVDSNGLLPLRAADRAFPTAQTFRRFLQKTLREHLLEAPKANPWARTRLPDAAPLPAEFRRRWPAATPALLAGAPDALARLPLDHTVTPAATEGGSQAASQTWRRFLAWRLERYAALRNHPDDDATSGLSPYLHCGHIAAHRVFHDLAAAEEWNPGRLAARADGAAAGWWGMSESAEGFLDELVTWREVGFNRTFHRDDYDRWDSLPDWARRTLAERANDPRDPLYALDELERAATHDPLWNAAQRQLVREGRLHNYLRMLWGKKILQWTASPEEALETMIQLNNKYALDGCDPNSYAGILWVLGRYDRPWGPRRPIFGTVRYMSSESAARKVRVKEYLRRYGP